MNRIIAVVCLALLFCGCAQDGGVTEETASSTTSTRTTTTSTTTTSLSYLNVTETEGCLDYEEGEERDNCYLTLAVSDLDMDTCGLIEKTSKRLLCEMTVGGQKNGSAEIFGYVLRSGTREPVKGVKVYAISQDTGEEVAVDTTDSKGYYSLKVQSAVKYDVTASDEGRNYTQTQYARNAYKHELWFIIP